MGRLLFGSIHDLRRSFLEGESTPSSILEETLQQIARTETQVNFLGEIATASARQAAAESDARWRRGEPAGDLDGVPVTVKDSINVAGLRWRHGVAANRDLPSVRVDAPPAARLREAGAVIVGKTTMPDFGMLAAGVSSLYGITRNPWNLSRSPGGSSSGAAAALASGVGYAAVGTDIAGSVRIPAGFCGLVALKPTQGRIAHIPSSNIRSAGPMARHVSDMRVMFKALARPDHRDASSLPATETGNARSYGDLVGLRIGVLDSMGYGTAPEQAVLDAVDAASESLRAGGARVESVAPPFDSDPYPALDRVFQVRAWTELQAIPPDRRADVNPLVAAWAESGKDIDAAGYLNDLASVASSAGTLSTALSDFDAVVSPVFPRVGFPAEAVGLDSERPLADCAFTCWFNQTGQPAASICFGSSEGMPVGVQVVGPRFSDDLVIRLCEWLESSRPLELTWPDLSEEAPIAGRSSDG